MGVSSIAIIWSYTVRMFSDLGIISLRWEKWERVVTGHESVIENMTVLFKISI